MDDDDYWLMDGNRLLSFEEDERDENENVYMRKIE